MNQRARADGNTQEPPRHQEPLYTEKVFSDRKIFFMDLKENNRGRFLKITEDVRGRRDTILVPIEALDDFIEALTRTAEFDDENPEAETD